MSHLEYYSMKEGEQMNELPTLRKEEVAYPYEGEDFDLHKSKGLALEPNLLNSLLCCTMLPKSGDTRAIRMKYYMAIDSILKKKKVN